jgi:hypothetical protein
MKIHTALSLATLAAAAVLAGACAGRHDNQSASPDDNSDGYESSAASAQSSRLDQMIFSPVASNDPSAAANSVASASEWWPAGCATRSLDATPGIVHVHLNECTGPFGLVHWNGDIDITFTAGAAGAVHASAVSRDMTVNGKAVAWSREGDITVSGSTRTVVGTSTWTRPSTINPDETVVHNSSWTVKIDVSTGCRTADGTASTKVGIREHDTTVSGYTVCRNGPDGSDGCPTGTVSIHFKLSGKTYTITFDGSEEAKISNGTASIEYPLVCVAGTK